eukprot:TRINITY_DN1295_c0_g2_i2.p1 TRINITY_DN1295_c0_g2~~TRINITY_DN1295_c0_g2_i2.p1  ORF type:complete len:200 (+),score=35.24 TRINITY_DN1295_c0_g2_i2:52-651(+)
MAPELEQWEDSSSSDEVVQQPSRRHYVLSKPLRYCSASEIEGFDDNESTDGDEGQSTLEGTWCLHSIDGDMQAIMVDAGIGWLVRKTAAASNYGCGLISQKIHQSGDSVEIEYVAPGFKNPTCNFSTSGKESKTCGEDGGTVIIKGHWEGCSLIVEGNHGDSGKPIQKSSRYLQSSGRELVHEIFSSKGVSVKRIYRKA